MKSKKRFHYQIDEVGVYYYICDGGKTEDKIFAEVIGDVKEVTDKLNDLVEEKEELRYKYNEKSNEYIGLEEQVEELLKEKEELKRRIEWFKEVIHRNGFKVKE